MNLFLLLKSYILSTNLIVYKMYIIISNVENENILIYKNINIYLLHKINFMEFYEWYKKNFEYDYEYIKKHEISGIRIVYIKIEKEDVDNIYPIYPWTDEWKIFNNF